MAPVRAKRTGQGQQPGHHAVILRQRRREVGGHCHLAVPPGGAHQPPGLAAAGEQGAEDRAGNLQTQVQGAAGGEPRPAQSQRDHRECPPGARRSANLRPPRERQSQDPGSPRFSPRFPGSRSEHTLGRDLPASGGRGRGRCPFGATRVCLPPGARRRAGCGRRLLGQPTHVPFSPLGRWPLPGRAGG